MLLAPNTTSTTRVYYINYTFAAVIACVCVGFSYRIWRAHFRFGSRFQRAHATLRLDARNTAYSLLRYSHGTRVYGRPAVVNSLNVFSSVCARTVSIHDFYSKLHAAGAMCVRTAHSGRTAASQGGEAAAVKMISTCTQTSRIQHTRVQHAAAARCHHHHHRHSTSDRHGRRR